MSHSPNSAVVVKAPLFTWTRWRQEPLYLRILFAMIVGVVLGLVLGNTGHGEWAADLAIPSKLVLRLLGALAPPLILVAIIHALMTADIKGAIGAKMVGLLFLNTLVAIGIGLLVANVVRPGDHSSVKLPAVTRPSDAGHPGTITPAPTAAAPVSPDGKPGTAPAPAPEPAAKAPEKPSTFQQMLDNVPQSLLGPLGDNGKVIGVIFIAIAFGMALRQYRELELKKVEDIVLLLFNCLVTILHWIIEIVPFAVFGIVASIIGTKGLEPFKAIGAFVLAVILALLLQTCYYLTRIRLGSWVRPVPLISGLRDALTMAFSTGSSTITMPVTYARLKERVGLRERSASMGALVGSNFNNDGTALYEAMSALFVAQLMGLNLTFPEQCLVVLTSVIASVGAAGIPEAGLVTMTMVFTAVHLPTEYIAILLTTDWFLDRCRTVINVLGDVNISCLLDGKTPKTPEEAAEEAHLVPV